MPRVNKKVCKYCNSKIVKNPDDICRNCPTVFSFAKCFVCKKEFSIPKIINRYDIVKTCGVICRSAYNNQLPARSKKEYNRGHSQNRSRKIRAGDKIDPFLVGELFGWICIICDKSIDPTLKHPNEMCATLEHVIPLSKREGTHTWQNAALAHGKCNNDKNNDLVEEIVEKAATFWRSLI